MTETSCYSAGIMSQSFWFIEIKKAIRLRSEGIEYAEIKKKCVDENLFGATKEYRASRIAGYIIARLKEMDDTLIDLFCTSDLPTQKIINLITILKTDRLFFEFVYEVYRGRIILGAEIMDDMSLNAFFTEKEAQSELIAGWKDSTKRKLRNIYMSFLTDANLLAKTANDRVITPPVLDIALERYLIAVGDVAILKALTGVK